MVNTSRSLPIRIYQSGSLPDSHNTLRMVSGTIHDTTTGSAARIESREALERSREEHFCQFTLANRGAGVEPRRILAPGGLGIAGTVAMLLLVTSASGANGDG